VSQRARLARIAALTAGPTKVAAAAISSSESAYQGEEEWSLLRAMCPPLAPLVSGMKNSSDVIVPSTKDSGVLGTGGQANPIDSTLAKSLAASDHLTALLKHAGSLRLALRASTNIAEDVSRRHGELLRQSGELSAAAERLQTEADMLGRHAEEIGMPLRHYDAVDQIGVLVGILFKDGGRTVVQGIARLKVDSDDFELTLDEIDAAVEFFGTKSGGKEALEEMHRTRGRAALDEEGLQSGSLEYYRRATALHDAALYLLREAVADRIAQTSKDVVAALNTPRVPIAADKLEASLVYTRFHGISSRSNSLILLVKRRLDRNETYGDLLSLCRNTYCSNRETLLKSSVRMHMDKLRDRHGLVGMTRLASVFLIRLCTVETTLYLDFFGEKDKMKNKVVDKNDCSEDNEKEDKADENGYVENLKENGGVAKEPADIVRKSLSSASNPNPQTTAATLASQVMSEDGIYYDAEFQALLGTLCSALHRTIRRGLVAVHDLDTLCQVVSVLREEKGLANSSPTTMAAAKAISAVIVDVQERLIFCANAALQKEVVRFRPTPNDLDYPVKLTQPTGKAETAIKKSDATTEEGEDKGVTEGAPAVDDDAVQAQLRVYESWFPPMRSVLRVLSKIFRVVEPRVFEDIALQSVSSCTRSLKDGSAHVLKKSGRQHADLFLVKHLLILREQLSPFDIQLRSVERQLDFSEAGKAVSRFLANRNRHLFAMSAENALVTLLREGISVRDSSVDSKRDLDDALRSACNDFIEHTSTAVAGPLLLFVEQCKSASQSTDIGLSAQPFMRSDAVLFVVEGTKEKLGMQLLDITNNMGLYLENPATQSILLKPVVRKITRALDEAKRFVSDVVDDNNGWDAEIRVAVLGKMQEIETSVKGALSLGRTYKPADK